MRSIRRARAHAAGAAAFTVAAATVTLAAAAFACTPSNLISVSTPAGSPGTPVGVSGSAMSANEVVVRWNGADGPVLARATPADLKLGAVKFSVPDTAPGYYVVTAVQSRPNGDDLLARATFQVVGPGGQTAPNRPDPFAAPAPTESASTGVPLALAFILGLGGLGLLGAGAMVAGAGARRRRVAAVAATTERH